MRLPAWLTRPFANVAALAHDLVAWPREVLLVRAHHRWVGALYLAVLSVPALFGYQPRLIPAVAVLVIGGSSLGLDLLGMVAHVAWHRGRIWQSTTCPLCSDDDDGPDDDPDPDPDVPDVPYGLTLADHAWLHSISVKAPTAV
ncbi:hypothetical protein [Streptomyces sp. NPDC091215]|uniref:hypothetical protein n=1 Tax=Streptomyces sp. NPDC091215 TaxID=3155192 RepID=UPI0034416546